MVVKAVRGRRRYIAFTLDSDLDRNALIAKLQELKGEDIPYVVQCSEGWAIIRTFPDRTESTIALMSEACVNSRPLSTSGTLKTLRSRYPRLQETRPPRRK